MLERNLERLAADLHEVHALRSGEHFLHEAEATGGTHDLAHVVVDRDGLALSALHHDVVVGAPVDGDRIEAGLFDRQCDGRGGRRPRTDDAAGRLRRHGAGRGGYAAGRSDFAGRGRRGSCTAGDDDVACVRHGVEVDIAAIDLGFKLCAGLRHFGLGAVVLDADGKRVVVLRNFVGDVVRELNRDGAAAAGFNLGGFAFLEVHGNVAHRGDPDVLIVLLGPLEGSIDGVDIRRRVVGVAVLLALETMGEECGPAVALDDFLHSAGKVVRALELAFGTGHGGRNLSPVGGTVLAHFIGHALPAAVADTAHDVVLENGAFVRHVAVRVGDCDDAVFLLDFAFDSSARPWNPLQLGFQFTTTLKVAL